MSVAWLILILLAAWCLAVAAHEAGHVVAGLLLRFRFVFFIVGPLCLVAEGGRLGLRWNRVLSTWGGMAKMIPKDCPRLAARMALYAAGGPLTSLVVAVAAYSTGAAPIPGTAAWHFAMAVALMSSAVLVATIQPFGSGNGIPSDGGRILMFLRHRAKAEASASELWAAIAAHQGAALDTTQQPNGADASAEPCEASPPSDPH